MTFKFTKTLLCLLLLSTAVFAQQSAHDVQLDDHEAVPQAYQPLVEDYDEERPSSDARLLRGFSNIRIVADYEYLTAGTDAWKTYIQKQLVPAVVDYLQGALKIKYPLTSPIQSSASTLCGLNTPVAIQNGVADADIVVIFSSQDAKGSSWYGTTTLCTVSSGVKRPTIVNIALNTAQFVAVADPQVNYIRHDLNINNLVHEFVHALGMNTGLWENFVDDEGNVLQNHIKTTTLNGSTRTVLDLPHLTERLRRFYGCDSIPGLVLESGTSLHFARRFFQWEVMSTAGITGSQISEVTLAFLEGTGWYVPDYCFAEPYFFGKGQGCGFYADDMVSSNYPEEYCTGSAIGCTETGHSGGSCVSDSLIKVAKVITHNLNWNCENPSGAKYSPHPERQVYGRGTGSKCFSGNLNSNIQNSYCLTFTCEGKGLSTILYANWGSDKITCSQEGPVQIDGYNGLFNCPDPVKYCSTVGAPACPRNCMGRGTCLSGKCVCQEGYFGTDCGFSNQ